MLPNFYHDNQLHKETSYQVLAMEPRLEQPPKRPYLTRMYVDDFSHAKVIAKEHGVQPPRPLEEIRREAQGRSRRLCASQDELRAILERHETTIRKRWSKKTKAQRQAILLKAWPSMAAAHRPDLELLSPEEPSLTEIDEKHRECFIWPHINQEDLSKSNTLLLLVNARGRHDPCDFAAADGETLSLGISVKAVTFSNLTQGVMILNGAVGPDEYGKVVPLNEHPDAGDWLVSRTQFLPEKGLIILEAQERLLSFLVSCCKQILHDIPDQALTSEAFPIKSPPQLKKEAETSGFTSLAVMASEAPYRVPKHLDFGRIEALLAAKVSALEDHMWSLREDPGYFAHIQQEIIEHRREQIRDAHGKTHKIFEKSVIHVFKTRVINLLVETVDLPLELYSELQLQAQNLRLLQERYSPIISPLRPLPKDYLRAILKFRHYLREAAGTPICHLWNCLLPSPPMRRHFVRLQSVDEPWKDMAISAKPGTTPDNFGVKLIRHLSFLWENDLGIQYLQRVIDGVEHLLDSEQQGKEYVSPYIASLIGELSVISQCITELELYQPWASVFEFAMQTYGQDIQEEFKKTSGPVLSIRSVQLDKKWSQVVRLGDISTGKFEYPIEKRRTKENVERLRKSEANLDAFWASVDELVHAKTGNLGGAAVQRLFSQPRIIQRTPKWVEPIGHSKKTKTVPTTDQDVEALYKPLSALYFGLNASKIDSPDTSLSRKKVKTRGAPKASPIDTAAESPLKDPSPSDLQPTIAVNARALKVFRTLFFKPSPTATPGEVAWNDLLHALTSVGFAAEKLYGSVWQFRPVTLSVDRSIQFHEPHPSGKIPFRDARRHGRRLNRAYGWCGDMFVLKEK